MSKSICDLQDEAERVREEAVKLMAEEQSIRNDIATFVKRLKEAKKDGPASSVSALEETIVELDNDLGEVERELEETSKTHNKILREIANLKEVCQGDTKGGSSDSVHSAKILGVRQ